MRRAPLRLVSLFTLTSFLGSQALAGSVPTVAVPPLGDSPDQRASDAIGKAFKAAGKVSVVDRAAVDRYLQTQRKTVAGEIRPGREASEALAKGENAYRRLKIQEAVNWLTKAKLAYRKQLLDDESFQGLRAAQFHLAMTYLASRDEARATEELREVVRLDPERNTRKLSEKLYPPSIRALYKKVRDETAKKPHGDLEVSSAPAKAMVYVDGKAVGPAPVTVRSLPLGEHFVRIAAEGSETNFAPKFIVAGENRLEAELKPLAVIDPYKTFGTVGATSEIDHRRAAFLDEMGLALGADIILFLTPGQAEVSGQLYDQRSQEVSPVVTDASPEGLVAKLVRCIDSEGYVFKPAEPEKRAEAAAEKKLPTQLQPDAEGTFSSQARAPKESEPRTAKGPVWYRNPWIWAAVGGGLLVAGGLGILLFTDIGRSDSRSTLKVNIP